MKPLETIYYEQHKILAAKNIYNQGDLNTLTWSRFSVFFSNTFRIHAVILSSHCNVSGMLHISSVFRKIFSNGYGFIL